MPKAKLTPDELTLKHEREQAVVSSMITAQAEALQRTGSDPPPNEGRKTPSVGRRARVPDRTDLAHVLAERWDEMQEVLSTDGPNSWKNKVGATDAKTLVMAMDKIAEKLLLLQNQPTAIIGAPERQQLDLLVPALLTEVKRRGLKVRAFEIEVPPE